MSEEGASASMTPVGRARAVRTSTPVVAEAVPAVHELPDLSPSSSVEASLNLAVDHAESSNILGGSGDSAILAVPVYRKAVSFSTSSSTSDPDSGSACSEDNMVSPGLTGENSIEKVDMVTKNLSNLNFRTSSRGHCQPAASDSLEISSAGLPSGAVSARDLSEMPTTQENKLEAAIPCAPAEVQKTCHAVPTMPGVSPVIATVLQEAPNVGMFAPTDGTGVAQSPRKATAQDVVAPPGVSDVGLPILSGLPAVQNAHLSLDTAPNAPTSLVAQNQRPQRPLSYSQKASTKLKARKEAKEGRNTALKRKKTILTPSAASISAGKQLLLTKFFSESLNLPGAPEDSKFGLVNAVAADKSTCVHLEHGSNI